MSDHSWLIPNLNVTKSYTDKDILYNDIYYYDPESSSYYKIKSLTKNTREIASEDGQLIIEDAITVDENGNVHNHYTKIVEKVDRSGNIINGTEESIPIEINSNY
jgi:hypothetical protein